MIYTYPQLRAEFKRLGYQWPFFHLIGVRSKADIVNKFDDKFYLIIGGQIKEYTGTTNPGTYWHENYDPKKGGVALLKEGQWLNCWTLGKHRGLYDAWTQVKPVTVYRDADKDGKSEKTEVTQNGLFGINIHRASENAISKLIDRWSAGCQVLAAGSDYKEFIQFSKDAGQKFFTYTLLDEF
jgi:hypothetical protein